MWELEIAKIFCLEKKLKKFHRLFLSCNEPINDVKKIVEEGEKDTSKNDNHLIPLYGKKKMKEKKKSREENFREINSDVESSADKLAVAIDHKCKKTKCEWCCACEKCAFIFLLLSAWMPLQGTLRRTVLYCTVLYCTVLYCTVLYCTVLYCTVLHCTALYCTVLYCTVLYCLLHHSGLPYSTLLRHLFSVHLLLFYTLAPHFDHEP